jgi:hypothetical protein
VALIDLLKAAEEEGCGDVSEPARRAVQELMKHWQKQLAIPPPGGGVNVIDVDAFEARSEQKAIESLREIAEAANQKGFEDIAREAEAKLAASEQADAVARKEAEKLLQDAVDLRSILDVALRAQINDWEDLCEKASAAFEGRLLEISAAKNVMLTYQELAKSTVFASRHELKEGLLAMSVLDSSLKKATEEEDAIELLTMSRGAEAESCSMFAGQARLAMRTLVDRWAESEQERKAI